MVEIKDDKDDTDENRAKMRFASEHIDRLNAAQDVRRYHMKFLSPVSYDAFFQHLKGRKRDGLCFGSSGDLVGVEGKVVDRSVDGATTARAHVPSATTHRLAEARLLSSWEPVHASAGG